MGPIHDHSWGIWEVSDSIKLQSYKLGQISLVLHVRHVASLSRPLKHLFFPFLLPFGRKASMIDCDILEVKFPSSLGFKFSNTELPAPTAQPNPPAQFLARCLQLWE